MGMRKYPTTAQIRRHEKQVSQSIRLYLMDINKDPAFMRNSLRCLFTDIGLDILNHGGDPHFSFRNFMEMITGGVNE